MYGDNFNLNDEVALVSTMVKTGEWLNNLERFTEKLIHIYLKLVGASNLISLIKTISVNN